ncbi:MAG: FAD-dependent oxidoreductase, partial [Thermomicrobiales bacterium]|nr:FAD-dependent oxidoreductase [Thermomicrobiales bacterium]
MRRDEQLERLDRIFDVLVIGGGATGLGVALDSASRGYATLLVEARDFAQGTSSRSTKLVHGGVRYLERGDIKLVYEALHERGRLIRNAPHLVHELRFLVPAYSAWQIPYYGIGLKAYDILAGRLGLSRSTVVGKKGATHLVPTIAQDGLKGGVIYSDAQFNDTRLAMILARTAVEHGATILNDAPVRSLKKDRGRIVGAVVEDTVSGRTYDIRARAVVNATGVFSDAIRQMDEPDTKPMMAPSQGVHLILDRSFLPSDAGILIPKTDDGRVVFIIPWQGHTLAGTTDTELPHPELEPTAHDDEIDFILEHVDRYLTRRPTRADVRAVFAGLRPLVRPA